MKKFYIILITILALFVVHLYWFGIRPTNIKKTCYLENQSSKERLSALDVSDARYEELVDRAYEDCLRKNGL